MNILTIIADCGTFKIQRNTGSAIYLSNAGYATQAAAYAIAQRRASYEPNTVAVAEVNWNSDPLGFVADLDALRSGAPEPMVTVQTLEEMYPVRDEAIGD